MTLHDDVVVVVPMYNEAVAVGTVVTGLRGAFSNIVCIDDGSTDDSTAVAREAGATVLVHTVNLGQGAALQTGFEFVRRHSTARFVVTFDSDGQHRVEDAVAMVAEARTTGVDVVLGSRNLGRTEGQTRARKLLLRGALRYSRAVSGLALTDTHNGLRVLTRQVLDRVVLRQQGSAHASELESLIARHRLSWVEHPVTIEYSAYSRQKGQSALNAVNVVYDMLAARLETSA
ncbi:glycosyltransferase family 2 protein [Nocardioides sp. AN3]